MAKGSVILGKISGSAGNLTFSVLKGQQVVKAKQSKRPAGSLPTYNQAWQQMKFKWASLMAQLTTELSDHSFTKRKATESSTNKFVSVNVNNFNPINKKILNIYDTSEELSLTLNRFQISNGDLDPINFDFSKNESNWDFSPFRTQSEDYDSIALNLFGLLTTKELPGEEFKFSELLENAEALTNAAEWATNKGLKAGEMLTAVFIFNKAQQVPSWGADYIDLPAELSMGYIRFKLGVDGKTFIVEASQGFLDSVQAVIVDNNSQATSYVNAALTNLTRVAGMGLIHSKEISGGWLADDTFIERLAYSNTNKVYEVAPALQWTQQSDILFVNGWSTQSVPILDPASLTEYDSADGHALDDDTTTSKKSVSMKASSAANKAAAVKLN